MNLVTITIHYDQIEWIPKMQVGLMLKKIHTINDCISRKPGKKEMKHRKWFQLKINEGTV